MTYQMAERMLIYGLVLLCQFAVKGTAFAKQTKLKNIPRFSLHDTNLWLCPSVRMENVALYFWTYGVWYQFGKSSIQFSFSFHSVLREIYLYKKVIFQDCLPGFPVVFIDTKEVQIRFSKPTIRAMCILSYPFFDAGTRKLNLKF